MPRYLLSFLLLYIFFLCYVLFRPTSPPLMLCVYLQTFEAALFWKKKKKAKMDKFQNLSLRDILFYYNYSLYDEKIKSPWQNSFC